MSDETIEKIKAELFRLQARVEDVGPDGIEVGNRGHGNAVLQCQRGRDFNWFGSADEILERLSVFPTPRARMAPNSSGRSSLVLEYCLLDTRRCS